jgi:hypothetical protein
MKNAFNLKNFLSENRNTILYSYESIKSNQFFTGITLKEFMLKILSRMNDNNPKSEKRASSLLPTIIGEVAFNHSRPHTF